MDIETFRLIFAGELPLTRMDKFVVYLANADIQSESEVLVCYPHSLYIRRHRGIDNTFPELVAQYGQEHFIRVPDFPSFHSVWEKRRYLLDLLKMSPIDSLDDEMEQVLQQHINQLE